MPSWRNAGKMRKALILQIICSVIVLQPVWHQDLFGCNNLHQKASPIANFTVFNISIISSYPLCAFQDNSISKSKVRYYSNSLQHRVKNRIWQMLLLLLPKLREVIHMTLIIPLSIAHQSSIVEGNGAFVCTCVPTYMQEFVTTLLNLVFEAGFCSNQASVKYMIEWMMILILVLYPQHIDSFWACFSTVSSQAVLLFFLTEWKSGKIK